MTHPTTQARYQLVAGLALSTVAKLGSYGITELHLAANKRLKEKLLATTPDQESDLRYLAELMPLIAECLGYDHLLTMKLPTTPKEPS